MVLRNLGQLDWKSLIDVDSPNLSIPYVLQDRRTGELYTTPKEYEMSRKRILETELP